MRKRVGAEASTDADAEGGHEEKSREPRLRRLSTLSGLLLLVVLGAGGRLLWVHTSVSVSAMPPSAVGIGSLETPPMGQAASETAATDRRAAGASGIAAGPKGVAVAPVVPILTVADEIKKELGACRSKDQILDALRCTFSLIYAAEETEAATYGLHTAHPENIYGEIPPESIAQIASELGLGKPGAVFYDLGSGVGKMTLQVSLTTEAARAVGVEIAVPRHKVALRALQALQRANIHTLLPESPALPASVEFLAQDITELDLSDATGIYMASLYFPKEVMSALAEKLCKLKTGTRIMTLVKFPFDVYGKRRLPKDSPMQALRLRKSFSDIAMTWSEENNVFLYEVDREEAFPQPFDGPSATSRQLLDEVYRRTKIDRSEFATPEFTDALLNVVVGLQLGQGDEVCEVGATSGWMALFLALEGGMDRVFTVSAFNGADHDTPGARARAMLEELSPGRIPWHRRTDLVAAHSLHEFIQGSSDGKTKDFASECKSASVVVLHPMKSYEDGLDALSKLAQVLPAGAIVLALGMETRKNGACTFGMLPLLQDYTEIPLSRELGLSVSLDVFAVAPQDSHLASLEIPGVSSLRKAVAEVDVEQEALQRMIGEKFLALSGSPQQVAVDAATISQNVIRSVVDSTRFRRLLLVSSGISAATTGNLSFHSPTPPASSSHRRYGGDLPAMQMARLWLARFHGNAQSAYACLEANLYALSSYAPAITKREKKAGLFPEHTAIYGEVDPRGLASVIKKLGGLKSTDTFFDLGSGLGKAVLQVYASTPAARVVGVELAEARHKGAVDALAVLRHRFPILAGALDEGRSVKFVHEDVLKADLQGATVVWMGSLAFPQALMGKIAERLLEHASSGCRVVTMIEFPPLEPPRKRTLVQREELEVQVRWSHAKEAKLFVYEVVQTD